MQQFESDFHRVMVSGIPLSKEEQRNADTADQINAPTDVISILAGDYSQIALKTLQSTERNSPQFWDKHRKLREAIHQGKSKEEIYWLLSDFMGCSKSIACYLSSVFGG